MNKELEFFNNQINQVADYFENWLYSSSYQKHTPSQKDIYTNSLNSLDYDNKHNCIPCNLKDGAKLIHQFLSNHRDCKSVPYYLSIYSLLFYLQAERCAVVYIQLDYTRDEKDSEFDWASFPVLQRIKHWANFFKHPKSAMFIHHPTFHIESYTSNPNFQFDGIIDSHFVKKYYSGKRRNKELEKKLSNNDFKVFFPDLIEFTKELCKEFNKLIKVINSTIENAEKLKVFSRENL